MKYLHIIPPSQRMMLTYVRMLRENFPSNEHKILLSDVVNNSDAGLLLFDNVRTYESLGKSKIERFISIGKEMSAADRIVFHSFMLTKSWTVNILLNRSVLDKSIWVIWGIDLYNYERKGNGFVTALKNKIAYSLRKNIRYPVIISECDLEPYNKRFGKHPVLYAPYSFADERFYTMDNVVKKRINKLSDNPINSDNTDHIFETMRQHEVRIQVCHNGYPFNRHFDILKMLDRICRGDDRGKVLLCFPVSYGNGELTSRIKYVDALKSYATQVFTESVLFIEKMMPNNRYTEYLSQIDIAIFNAERQNALGNILQLLYMGKKVYLSDNSPLFPYLKNKGLMIHAVSELMDCTFEELIEPDSVSSKEWIGKAFSVNTMLELWKIIFSFCEGEMSYDCAFYKSSEVMQINARENNDE